MCTDHHFPLKTNFPPAEVFPQFSATKDIAIKPEFATNRKMTESFVNQGCIFEMKCASLTYYGRHYH